MLFCKHNQFKWHRTSFAHGSPLVLFTWSGDKWRKHNKARRWFAPLCFCPWEALCSKGWGGAFMTFQKKNISKSHMFASKSRPGLWFTGCGYLVDPTSTKQRMHVPGDLDHGFGQVCPAETIEFIIFDPFTGSIIGSVLKNSSYVQPKTTLLYCKSIVLTFCLSVRLFVCLTGWLTLSVRLSVCYKKCLFVMLA